MQTVVPDGVWLRTIDYDGSNVRFSGSATNGDDMQRLVGGLTESVFFNDVVLLSQSVQSTQTGSITNFEITSTMGEE
ncbi:MAG: PilN domain-containing protein [Bdellovibrionales bacterium]